MSGKIWGSSIFSDLRNMLPYTHAQAVSPYTFDVGSMEYEPIGIDTKSLLQGEEELFTEGGGYEKASDTIWKKPDISKLTGGKITPEQAKFGVGMGIASLAVAISLIPRIQKWYKSRKTKKAKYDTAKASAIANLPKMKRDFTVGNRPTQELEFIATIQKLRSMPYSELKEAPPELLLDIISQFRVPLTDKQTDRLRGAVNRLAINKPMSLDNYKGVKRLFTVYLDSFGL